MRRSRQQSGDERTRLRGALMTQVDPNRTFCAPCTPSRRRNRSRSGRWRPSGRSWSKIAAKVVSTRLHAHHYAFARSFD